MVKQGKNYAIKLVVALRPAVDLSETIPLNLYIYLLSEKPYFIIYLFNNATPLSPQIESTFSPIFNGVWFIGE